METEEIIVLKSVYSKTQGQVFYITPCIDPKTGMYPPHVREFDEEKQQMILSDKDREKQSTGEIVFIPANKPIKVTHGSTFNLNNKVEKAQWEAIKNSQFIAKDRTEKDQKGNYVIDGEKVHLDHYGNPVGLYGLADLYIERPGKMAKAKNDFRKLIVKAQTLIMEDDLDGRVKICRLLEKDMSHANPNDVEDYLFTLAEKQPDKIIELYTGNTAALRLLLITALEKHVVVKRDGLLIYSDNIVLGASTDAAVNFLSQPENVKVKELIQQETYPDLYKTRGSVEVEDDDIFSDDAKKPVKAVASKKSK